jgi:hypothetical protein
VQHLRESLIAPAPLIEVLRALPDVPADLDRVFSTYRSEAERHGLGGVLVDTCRASGATLADERGVAAREVARELDHTAHLAMLRRIDAVLADACIRAVALKGALLAERLYSHPSARGATDIDLLVADEDLERATESLRVLGYSLAEGPDEERFRREHHHVHLEHAEAIALELHFDAYRGFGAVLAGGSLVSRSVTWTNLRAVHVLAPDDELVYLMVHAAAHRFGRLSWLYDIKLLLATMSDDEIAAAAERARESGFAHVVSLAAVLVTDLAGVPRTRVAPLVSRDRVRRALTAGVAPEPKNPLLRSATRFVYTTALCATAGSAARYVKQASLGYVRRILASRS